MENPSSLFDRFKTFLKANGRTLLSVSGGAAVLFVCVTGYYYFTTSPATILVTAEDFPSGFSRFTQKDLMDSVAGRLAELTNYNQGQSLVPKGGFGIQPAKEVIWKSASDASSPAYNLQIKGFSLNLCRRLGMSLRTRRFLSVSVNDVSDAGWRLSAMMEEAPHYSAVKIGSAPAGGKLCTQFDICIGDLAETILESLDIAKLVNYYILQKNEDANRKILDVYAKVPTEKLTPKDFVVWGNAYQAVNLPDQALARYNLALEKDPKSCAAMAARGYTHDLTAGRDLQKLKLAEQELRTAVKCEEQNKFTLTSLCHVLTREWKQEKTETALLEEARQQCQAALNIDPNFTIAATNIGYILYRQNNFKESLDYFDRLSQNSVKDTSVFVNYGFVLYLEYLRTHDASLLERAVQETEKSFALDQSNSAAANNLGFYNYERRNYSAAVDYWTKAKAMTPNDPDVIAGLCLAYDKLGREGEAFALLKDAREADSNYKEPKKLEGDPHHWSPQMIADLTTISARLPK